MSGYYILDDDGQPVPVDDVMEWARWMEQHHDDRVVQQDYIETAKGTALLSTVFLGLDHSFGGRTPILWETMLFEADGHGEYQKRYSSREEALETHQALLVEARLVLNAVV